MNMKIAIYDIIMKKKFACALVENNSSESS